MSVSLYTLVENVGKLVHTGRKCRSACTHWQKMSVSLNTLVENVGYPLHTGRKYAPPPSCLVLFYPGCSGSQSVLQHSTSQFFIRTLMLCRFTYILFSHVKSNLKSKIPILCQHSCLLSLSSIPEFCKYFSIFEKCPV